MATQIQHGNTNTTGQHKYCSCLLVGGYKTESNTAGLNHCALSVTYHCIIQQPMLCSQCKRTCGLHIQIIATMQDYTEWPGTGHSPIQEGIIRGGVTQNNLAIKGDNDICYGQFTNMNIFFTSFTTNLLFLGGFCSSIKWQSNINREFQGNTLEKRNSHKGVHFQLIESYQQDTTIHIMLTYKIWAVAYYEQCPDTTQSCINLVFLNVTGHTMHLLYHANLQMSDASVSCKVVDHYWTLVVLNKFFFFVLL